jgi:hypothetical protein
MTNVVDFPNEDEVISDEDQEQAEYDADADRGYALGLEHRRLAYQIAEGLNEAEEDGFWDAFYS